MSKSTPKQAKIEQMIAILKEHQISMSVGGCGCCGSPDVTFSYKGKEIINEDYCNFDTDEDKETE